MILSKIKAYGKINLSLDVLGKRDSGYHDVKMIMHQIDLFDTILIEKSDEITVKTNLPYLPEGEGNIAYKAAKEFFRKTGINSGVQINIEKNIPVSAGLAGGSTNAAAVLVGLNEMFETKLQKAELCEIGGKIGADVPFCIMGGTMIAEGIGEKLTKTPSLPDCYILLAKPPVAVSTKWVYENLDLQKVTMHPDTQGIINALETEDLQGVAKRMFNVLESVTVKKHRIVYDIKAKMLNFDAIGSVMSGSGPTVVGIFDNLQSAKKAKSKVGQLANGIECFIIKNTKMGDKNA